MIFVIKIISKCSKKTPNRLLVWSSHCSHRTWAHVRKAPSSFLTIQNELQITFHKILICFYQDFNFQNNKVILRSLKACLIKNACFIIFASFYRLAKIMDVTVQLSSLPILKPTVLPQSSAFCFTKVSSGQIILTQRLEKIGFRPRKCHLQPSIHTF